MGQVRLTKDILRQDGETERGLAARVRQGELLRVRRGAYAGEGDAGALADHLTRAEAVLRQRPDAVLAGMSAAAVLGLPVDDRELAMVRVVSPRGHGNARAGVRQHCFALPGEHVTEVDGLRVTTAARTVVDVARLTGLEWGVAVADAALRQGLAFRDDLELAVARCGSVRRLKVAERAVTFADDRAASPLESISRVQMMRVGLPTPELQYRLEPPGMGIVWCDFAWPAYRVLGECDGWVKYGELLRPDQTPQDAVKAEKRRENGLRRLGWWVVRWKWADAWSPRRLEGIVRGAFHQSLDRQAG